ncbi:MAG: primosomal protein N' [Spirochaetes bacterium GWC2_52_13]|nr:MAG: primosomal protein N' [Spirochaetes bacterium GWC2_52_13]HCG62794.1 primosomal protein N' [Sphaerochaeta sp.]
MFVSVLLNNPLGQRFTYLVPPDCNAQVGMRAVVPFGNREVTAYIVEVLETIEATAYAIKPIKRVIDKEPLYGEREIELAKWMARFYLCSEGEALGSMIPSGRRDVEPALLPMDEDSVAIGDHMLSDEQQSTLDAILASSQPMHYLYGVTGSGKSEVFLRIAENVIAQGRQVIYLVPEITLTHQLARQVSKRFAGRVAILHSGMTPSQRLSAWRKIKRGEVQLAIGARSAVFAPFEQLGLIIIDEEHENSYKSGNNPRYHARQIAQKKASEAGAVMIMGSATPSLEAHLMMEEKKVVRHVLSRRVAGGVPPQVTVVNMLAEQRMLSKKLMGEMKATLAKGRQVILFLNRRGFSHYFHCRSCGYDMVCPHCSVALTYHKDKHRMVCHYCGFSRNPISVCPECSSVDVGYGGFGTEMVEMEVGRFFPQARIARLDTDSAKDKPMVATVLHEFREGKIDILLGTQMVAKGLNFPLVDLVGIVLADSALNLPDFRSQERTFSLIVQVSGRAGRYNDAGKVVVQTFHPDNTAIRLATNGNIEEFYRQELAARKETAFPPYTRLVNFTIRGRSKEKTEVEIDRLRHMVESFLHGLAESNVPPKQIPDILGSAPCPLEKIAGNWRHHLVLRGSEPSRVLQIATGVYEQYKAPSGMYLEIDLDPLQML